MQFATRSLFFSLLFFITIGLSVALLYFLIFKLPQKSLNQSTSSDDVKDKIIPLNQIKDGKIQSDKIPLGHLAHYDSITALPNRIFFNEILNKAISHAKRRKKICALLFIDIDKFKGVQEKLGKENSNLIIKELGFRLTATLRSEDILARLDEDEFVVLLSDIGKPKFASAVAEKLLLAISHPIKIDQNELHLSACIGICIYPTDGESLESLLKTAELALEKARHEGPGKYQFYTNEMTIEAKEFIQLETALRKALQKKELVLYFQPKYRIKTGNIDSVEALIRWVHPELGNITPAQIIHLSEEIGLTMQICSWALLEACRVNKYWQDEGYQHISIAINISPIQFHHPDIIKLVANALNHTKLNPGYLELEISESAVMEDVEASAEILNELKALGVQLTIDHFGTGYTSISHLKRFPLSFLKIDRSFVKGLPQNPNDLTIINAFIALAHNFGLEVIAEGVETAEQVQYLASQNCDVLQGYFLSHPLPPDRFLAQLGKLRDEVII